MVELNIQPDHGHLVISRPPTDSVAECGGVLKGKLALWPVHQDEQLARRYGGRHFWSRGSCVSTVGLAEEKIRLYVRWQETQAKPAEALGDSLD